MNKIPIINQIIKDKRKEIKLNQSDFAKLINKSKVTVARYDTGDIIPENTLILICDKLNLDMDTLLNMQGHQNEINDTEYYKILLEKKREDFLKNIISNGIPLLEGETLIADRIEELFRFFISPNTRKEYTCEYKNEKFYIKTPDCYDAFMILNSTQAHNLLNDLGKYFEFLLYNINQEKLNFNMKHEKGHIISKNETLHKILK